MPFGATAAPDGVRFAVWAPSVNEAAVEIDGRAIAMERAAQGFYHCFDPDAVPGARYAFRFDNTDIAIPDPASRFNPDGVHAPPKSSTPEHSNGTTTTGEGGHGPKPSSTSCTSARSRRREPMPRPPSGSITWPRSA